jgi:hypothetical protein
MPFPRHNVSLAFYLNNLLARGASAFKSWQAEALRLLGWSSMDLSSFKIPETLTAAGTFAMIYGAFAKFESIQSDENRRFVAAWLLGIAVEKDSPTWDRFFREFFFRFFGYSHFSLRCVRRSVGLSIVILAAVLTHWWIRHPLAFQWTSDSLQHRGASWWGLFGVVILACITDYFSLWKTRLLLKHFGTVTRYVSAFGLILVDAVATAILCVAGFWVAEAIWYWIFVSSNHSFGALWALLFSPHQLVFVYEAFTTLDPSSQFPVALMLLCAMATSAWIWLYILLAVITRLLRLMPAVMKVLPKIIDVDGHPVRSLGFIAAAVASGSVWLASFI